MEHEVEIFPILRLTKESQISMDEVVVREFPITIVLNNEELVTLLCSPKNLEYLAAGFLSSEGFLKSKDEIRNILVDDQRGVVRVETRGNKEINPEILFKRIISSGCGRGASFYSFADVASQKVESRTKISIEEIFALVNEFQHSSQLYLKTGGVHSAALGDNKSILIFAEDIGRHNAIDKIFGECLLKDISTDNRIIISSGRISSEILHKVAKKGIPIIISVSQPTNLGVRIADNLGITLVCSVRGKRMNVFTNSWRILTNGR
jgi:FdhD protein